MVTEFWLLSDLSLGGTFLSFGSVQLSVDRILLFEVEMALWLTTDTEGLMLKPSGSWGSTTVADRLHLKLLQGQLDRRTQLLYSLISLKHDTHSEGPSKAL